MAIIFIYLMRIVAGFKFFWHIDPVILHCQSLMRIVGFNGSATHLPAGKAGSLRKDDHSLPAKRSKEPSVLRHKTRLRLYEISSCNE
jgi:hypothetical protein